MANEDKRIDELLDGALAEYSNVEPRSGLEQRILANLASADAQPERSWLRWWPAIGLAAAAVLALCIMFGWSKKAERPVDFVKQSPTPTVVAPAPLEQPRIAKILRKAQPTRGTHPLRPAPQPARLAAAKQPAFPAASPLSDQERLLFSYMRRTDPQEIAANAKPDPVPAMEQQINQALPLQKNPDSNTNTR